MSETQPEVGRVYEAPYPFVRAVYTDLDEEGSVDLPTWTPGVRNEAMPPEGDTTTFADGLGLIRLTVVSTHKPGKYPLRVFYTRQWVTPEGKVFGKTACRVKTAGAFMALTRGYRHSYKLNGCACGGCAWPFEDHRRTWEEPKVSHV